MHHQESADINRYQRLLRIALGIWTGNARSSNKLKDAGWQGEDISCMEGSVIAIKTHKWHTFKVKDRQFINYES